MSYLALCVFLILVRTILPFVCYFIFDLSCMSLTEPNLVVYLMLSIADDRILHSVFYVVSVGYCDYSQ